MIAISNSQEASEAKYALERAMLNCSQWQLLLGDLTTATITANNCELSVEWGKLIFAWWDDDRSQNWRVVAYETDETELRLQVTRGLKNEFAMLTLRNQEKWRDKIEFENLELAGRRQLYGQTLAEMFSAKFLSTRIQRITTGSNRSQLVPGRYARLVLKLQGETALVIGATEAESQPDIDGVIAAGLIWLAGFNQQREAKLQTEHRAEKTARRLLFCLPAGRSLTAVERLTLLDASHLGAQLECFEIDERHKEMTALQLATQDELLNTHPRELDWPELPPAENPWRGRILRLAPGRIEVRQVAGKELYSINGLEFARASFGQMPHVVFGVAGWDESPAATLSEANFEQLAKLVEEIAEHRRANSVGHRHPFHRLREEAWLESLLRQNICALDAGLDDRFVYSQIPAWRGDERSVIDLLSVNHKGRLAVIEVKASEDVQLPLQGLDYWLRVEQARLRGEFQRRGLFGDIELADQPPLLYLVAPRLRFHRSFAIVARCLSPKIEAYQVGVNANWRSGIRARTCERINDDQQKKLFHDKFAIR
ncbi:MAG: hypothetical protein JST85_26250 [Acidobacteria bacterium]|nr:hypothetical protein [Acidobacteriota bacterium]